VRSSNEGVRVLAGFDGSAQAVAEAAPGQVAALLSQIETALQTIHTALAQIKQIQSKAG